MFTGRWRLPWLGRGRDPLRAAFGRLEREVMDVVWRGEPLSVREVRSRLPRAAAYTTVMTTLDRLFKKGFVERRREGRAFVYTAAEPRAQVEAAVAAGLVSGFLEQGPARPLLSNLVDAMAERDEKLLDELEALVKARRRRSAGPGGEETR